MCKLNDPAFNEEVVRRRRYENSEVGRRDLALVLKWSYETVHLLFTYLLFTYESKQRSPSLVNGLCCFVCVP